MKYFILITFILLHSLQKEELWININDIQYIVDTGLNTKIVLNNTIVFVKESPEQIIKLLRHK